MSFLQLSNLCLKFGEREILKNVTVNLRKESRAALVGANGCGKSTFMKIAAGLISADSGERVAQKNCRVVYLPQSGIVHSGATLRAEADKAFVEGYALHEEMENIGERLKTVSDEKLQTQLLERHRQINEYLTDSQWYFRSSRAEQVLSGLGFEKADFDKSVETFSGGWQMRIALAKVLLQNPDILLLDEPTNYLDIEARTWLQDFLLGFSGGFLLVSHDRYFLDTCVNEILELFNAELHRYAGNFTNYEKKRQSELESLIAQYDLQQEKIRKTEDFIRRFRYNAAKAAQVQERVKQLEKLPRIEIPESLKKIRFSFPSAPHSGKIVLRLEKIGKAYGDHSVLRGIDATVEHSDRLVVTGRNGAGKTTLLRILAGEDTAYEGRLVLGANVSIGYFSQDSAEKINGNLSVIDMLEKEAPLDLVPKLRDMLAAFLFRGDDIFKTIDVLSGGEKTMTAVSLLFATYMVRPSPFCLLDEIDAALDEANVLRFVQTLREFGNVSQYIVITHNKRTVAGAGTLLGVTMEESGVSKLITIKLENDGEGNIILPEPEPFEEEDVEPEQGVYIPPHPPKRRKKAGAQDTSPQDTAVQSEPEAAQTESTGTAPDQPSEQ